MVRIGLSLGSSLTPDLRSTKWRTGSAEYLNKLFIGSRLQEREAKHRTSRENPLTMMAESTAGSVGALVAVYFPFLEALGCSQEQAECSHIQPYSGWKHDSIGRTAPIRTLGMHAVDAVLRALSLPELCCDARCRGH